MSRSRSAAAPRVIRRRRPPQPAPRPRFRRMRRHTSPTLIFGAAALVLALAIGVVSAAVGGLAPLPAYLVAVNLATFALYGYDKAVAGRARLRVPEVLLHGLALVGGTVGALLGQRLVRHKVSKAPFQRIFLATSVVQVAVIVAWFVFGR